MYNYKNTKIDIIQGDITKVNLGCHSQCCQ